MKLMKETKKRLLLKMKRSKIQLILLYFFYSAQNSLASECGALRARPPGHDDEAASPAAPRPWVVDVRTTVGGGVTVAGGVLISKSHVLARASDLCRLKRGRRRKRLIYIRGLIIGDCSQIGP
jgi:hypothetical protein